MKILMWSLAYGCESWTLCKVDETKLHHSETDVGEEHYQFHDGQQNQQESVDNSL